MSSTLSSDTAPIEFEIKGQGDEYMDLSQTYVQLLCKFTKDDGGALTGVSGVSTPVNNIIHSLFSEIDLSLNGKIITPGTDTYPYKAYLEKLLSYEPNTLNTQMKACTMWQKDTPAAMNDYDLANAEFTPQKFDVKLKAGQSSGGAEEAIINQPLEDRVYPRGSRNEG